MEENIKNTVLWNVMQLVLVERYKPTESANNVNMKITFCHLGSEAGHSRRKLPASDRTSYLHHRGRSDLMFLTVANMKISSYLLGCDAVWSDIKLLTLWRHQLPQTFTLKVRSVCSSKPFVSLYQRTLCHIPEESTHELWHIPFICKAIF